MRVGGGGGAGGGDGGSWGGGKGGDGTVTSSLLAFHIPHESSGRVDNINEFTLFDRRRKKKTEMTASVQGNESKHTGG